MKKLILKQLLRLFVFIFPELKTLHLLGMGKLPNDKKEKTKK